MFIKEIISYNKLVVLTLQQYCCIISLCRFRCRQTNCSEFQLLRHKKPQGGDLSLRPMDLGILCEKVLSVLFGKLGQRRATIGRPKQPLGYYVRRPFPFFLSKEAQRRTYLLRKLKFRWRVSPLRRRRGLRALDLRKLLEKFDQNFCD